VNYLQYCIEHRRFTFRDEWLAYVAMTSLYAAHIHLSWPLWPFITAAIWGIITITISYRRQWFMEEDALDTYILEVLGEDEAKKLHNLRKNNQ